MMHPSSSPFLLPSPHYFSLEDGMIFDELLPQELHLFSENNIHTTSIAVHGQFTSVQSAMAKCSNTNGDDGSKKKRASKKDRHRKIDTAQGPRDRRMRLSVDVGKKFFKLQDMLGFDKASKTVEWLMMKSKSKIQELISHAKPRFSGGSMVESSTSRCELLCEDIEDNINAKSSSSSNRKGKKKMRREVRKISSKETREMARKRARERTLEKSSKLQAYVNGGDHDQTSMFRSCLDQTTEQDANHLASWIINEPEPLSWNPCFDLFDYQRTGVSLDQEHQFSDFEMPGSLWEVNN